MKKLLFLSLLLCKCLAFVDLTNGLEPQNDPHGQNYIADNIIALASRPNIYDYEDMDAVKRHSALDRKSWRKKTLLNLDHKGWDSKRRHDYDGARYVDDVDVDKNQEEFDRLRELELDRYRSQRRYEDIVNKNIATSVKSSEVLHPTLAENDVEKKSVLILNCDRIHEKFEPCFAGCAAISCDNPRERLRPCYPFCESGCICVHPYIRDDRTHKCVLPDDCSKSLKGIPDLGDDI